MRKRSILFLAVLVLLTAVLCGTTVLANGNAAALRIGDNETGLRVEITDRAAMRRIMHSVGTETDVPEYIPKESVSILVLPCDTELELYTVYKDTPAARYEDMSGETRWLVCDPSLYEELLRMDIWDGAVAGVTVE